MYATFHNFMDVQFLYLLSSHLTFSFEGECNWVGFFLIDDAGLCMVARSVGWTWGEVLVSFYCWHGFCAGGTATG